MIDIVINYLEYISRVENVVRPKMPIVNKQVYDDREYLDILTDIEPIDDFTESIEECIDYLEGR